jgi:hypothetical protein
VFFDEGPQMPRVFVTEPFACGTKRGTRITASNKVNSVSKEVRWEGFSVRPYRRGMKQLVFHLRNQVRNDEGFDLHISDDSMSKPGKVKSSFDATISRA